MPAYRITYSFSGAPMASDEYGNTRFTFSVYFQPDDLTPAVRERMSAHQIGRDEAAQFLKLTTSRALVQRVSIDERNSSFCAGNYVDGLWARLNAGCEANVAYKTIAEPSSYVTVTVDPASPRPERSAIDRSGLGRQ